jgi:hypothetical protein
MQCNVAGWDRGVRIVAGLALLTLGWSGMVPGTLGLVFKVLGFVPLVTGIIGYCPAYGIFRTGTRRV